jgi:hypothetical protein
MDLKDSSINVFAEKLAHEIDKHLLETLHISKLINDGWVMPAFNYSKSNVELGAWVHLNTKGNYKNLDGRWIFQDPADATLFTLRWS